MLIADKFESQTCIDKCFEPLVENLDVKTACHVMELAHEFRHGPMFDLCLSYIEKNARWVLERRDVTQLCVGCFKVVISSDELAADEGVVFRALVRWGEGRCARQHVQPTKANMREQLGELRYHVRYIHMDIDTFEEHVQPSVVLTTAEKAEITKAILEGTENTRITALFRKGPREPDI